MANEEAIGWNLTEHRRLRIVVFLFGRLQRGLLFSPTALVVNADIAESQVFNIVTGYSGDERGVSWFGVIDDYIVDVDAS